MAVRSAQVNVTTTATSLIAPGQDDSRSDHAATVRNAGAVSVFLGPSDVTSGNGFELPAGAAETLDLEGGERVYAITSSGSARVDVLRSGVV